MLESPRERLAEARLYLLCESIDESRLEDALRGGVDIVDLLDTGQSDGEMLDAAAGLRVVCERGGALFMLNNRPELVARAGADGVHIDKVGIDLEQARATIGADKLLGTSTHSSQEVDDAQQLPLDYISVGPVHSTPIAPRTPRLSGPG